LIPYIIVTNDDGVSAPGIAALAAAMRQIGRVEIVAPAINQSASGHKKTLYQEIPYAAAQTMDGQAALAISGSPADCIALAALGMLDWAPDLVVSGINRGPNMGQDVTYSGTVSAALEASICGVPAVAFSLDQRHADTIEDYAEAARVAVPLVQRTLEKKLPPLTILNVNIPPIPRVRGIRLTRQGIRIYQDELERAETYCRIVGPEPTGMFEEEGTDLWAVHQGYVSLTPIHLDLTAHRLLADVAAWDISMG